MNGPLQLDWLVFFETVPDTATAWWMMLAGGFGWTLACAACSWTIALAAGTAVGIARTASARWLARAGRVWVEAFRNVPLIVQLFLWYFVAPAAVPGLQEKIAELDPAWFQFGTAVAGLGLFTSARIAEQVRAGIEALPRGQRWAAQALGLRPHQVYRHVLLPAAFRIILPPLTSELMNLVKNTAVAYSIGLTELFFRTREMGETTFRWFEAFSAATVVYALTAFGASRLMGRIERRTAVPGFAGAPR